jgi:hypothetical protein
MATYFGYHQNYEAVHQYWNANDEKFYLGVAPSTYCPNDVQSLSAFPTGNVTAFSGLLDLVGTRIRATISEAKIPLLSGAGSCMPHMSHVSRAKSCVNTPQSPGAKPSTLPAKATLASPKHSHLPCL